MACPACWNECSFREPACQAVVPLRLALNGVSHCLSQGFRDSSSPTASGVVPRPRKQNARKRVIIAPRPARKFARSFVRLSTHSLHRSRRILSRFVSCGAPFWEAPCSTRDAPARHHHQALTLFIRADGPEGLGAGLRVRPGHGLLVRPSIFSVSLGRDPLSLNSRPRNS